ncbi:MAG: hypothetical protein Q4A71_01800 [Actinomycetaceae bacterium]|nr:hypothetical protein [Actinomycetaceae bacterium]
MKNWKDGYLPDDPYRSVDYRLEDYAKSIFLQKCMAKKGFDFPVVPFDWHDPLEPTIYSQGLSGTLTEERAQKYGYRKEPATEREKLMRQRHETIAGEPQAWREAFNECDSDVKKVPPFKGSESLVEDRGGGGSLEWRKEVKAAAAKWHKCMEPLGIPDLPSNPWESPGPTLGAKFGMSNIDDPESLNFDGSNVSPEEFKIAVFDAKCREKAKYHQILYDLYWQDSERNIAKHKGEFQARLNAIQKKNKEYKAYIEANR